MVLVNGTEGLGSGYKSLILPRNPKKIEKYITDYLKGSLRPNKSNSLEPYYEGFNGTIEKGENKNQWIIKGVIKRLSKMKIEITDRRSYELLIKLQVDKSELSNKKKSVVRRLVLKAFDDGRTFQRDGKLEHKTDG